MSDKHLFYVCRLVLSVLLSIAPFTTFSQITDSVFYVQKKPNGDEYRLEVVSALNGTSLEPSLMVNYYHDSVSSFHPINIDTGFLQPSIANINYTYSIFFVSDSLGFLYGTNSLDRSYPFLYRTIDSGVSWELVLGTENGGYMFEQHEFYMFNINQGIAFFSDSSPKEMFKRTLLNHRRCLRYYLTNDGGVTWEYRKKRMKKTHLEKRSKYRPSYSDSGTIEFRCRMLSCYSTDLPVLKSLNYGRTFKYVND